MAHLTALTEIHTRQGLLASLPAAGWAKGRYGSPEPDLGAKRVQAQSDGTRLSQSFVAGERLPVRLRRTGIDGPDAHGMQEARGSSPLSSTFPQVKGLL